MTKGGLLSVPNEFDQIYAAGGWDGMGSGPGSTEKFTRGYRQMLQRFMRKRQIKSVLDIGCGEFGFMSLLDWTGIQYTGIDCVESVIAQNKAEQDPARFNFMCKAFQVAHWSYSELVIVKDVLHHVPTDVSDWLIRMAMIYPYVLWTVDVREDFRPEKVSDAAAVYFSDLEIVYQFDRAVEPYRYGPKVTFLYQRQ